MFTHKNRLRLLKGRFCPKEGHILFFPRVRVRS